MVAAALACHCGQQATSGLQVGCSLPADLAHAGRSRPRRKERLPAPGRRDGQQRLAGREWYWRLDIAGTQDTRIRRLDVQVFADMARTDPVAQLTGFAGDSVQP